jgi:hypothetical protein
MANWLSPNPFELNQRETAFKHLVFGTRFKFVDPSESGNPFTQDWVWVKTGHKTYRSPHAPKGKKYEHRTYGDARVVPIES